jgi:hypothetical protein
MNYHHLLMMMKLMNNLFLKLSIILIEMVKKKVRFNSVVINIVYYKS